jgi:hypothetical protein
MKVVRLSALPTGRLYPTGKYSWYKFMLEAGVNPRGYIATGRIMSMKNSNDNIGNRTSDLPACRAVPQPTALRRVPVRVVLITIITKYKTFIMGYNNYK